MNIQGIVEAYRAHLYAPAKAGKRAARGESAETRKLEKVEISTQSEQLQRLKRRVEETPEVRLEVVSRIKARIEMNDYPIENNLDETIKMLMDSETVAVHA